ncbi:MAG: YebC/PmpR family DNA-binding transcriptional regulator [Rudaea sp.]|uniref:YebC/PmpR family DNA-binding transcriptional regulator n=1 Tax=unclassified Rudaea TaxID=2627037 RepID=UPI0010FA10DE|nr:MULTISPECIES: YebC/PmpR family DNA-binding transcriptional regulator [unclassified Rudaea]MBN8887616.1 YebC/PmpR family DNA-binding transcriptional regulator [Rudaea sp.]
MGRGPSIEGRKNAEDARRGKIFTKLIREITIAARQGADPASNARLRAGIDKAKAVSMPSDTIERALKRASGADAADMHELRYEGYGPGGIAIIIDCMTDNQQRTVADVRSSLTKHGGNLGTSGSVAFQFKHQGELVFATPDAASEEKVLEVALEAGADDVQAENGQSTVLCTPENYEAVKKALVAAKLEPTRADVVWRPENRVKVEGETEETLRDLLDRLEELDDVQEVYHNAAIDDA